MHCEVLTAATGFNGSVVGVGEPAEFFQVYTPRNLTWISKIAIFERRYI